ncbi:hypothetical protein RMATCC62417_11314 [Rhizopus microsporus]|nr:hypothetical protein RMATCC62417_11314 [Rhizopus microsporus]
MHISQDCGRNEEERMTYPKSSSEAWIYHQREEEQIGAEENSRISRFSVRYDENDGISPKNKNRQVAEPCQASHHHRKEKVLQVDCKPYWENYLSDSSNRECLAACTLSAEGYGKEFEQISKNFFNQIRWRWTDIKVDAFAAH